MLRAYAPDKLVDQQHKNRQYQVQAKSYLKSVRNGGKHKQGAEA